MGMLPFLCLRMEVSGGWRIVVSGWLERMMLVGEKDFHQQHHL